MQTLVPIGTFEAKARRLLGKSGFGELLELLAQRPKVGRIIQGAGGLRKVRVARSGKGKSGGARVIYYYHNDRKPILLLLIYAKTDQENLTPTLHKFGRLKFVSERQMPAPKAPKQPVPRSH